MKNYFRADFVRTGKKIKLARQKLKKTQEEISEIAGISAQYWSAVETGRDRGSITTYLKVASALGLTLNDLFYDNADLIRSNSPKGWEEFLSDLTEYEKSVLTGTILAAKVAIIRSRKLL